MSLRKGVPEYLDDLTEHEIPDAQKYSIDVVFATPDRSIPRLDQNRGCRLQKLINPATQNLYSRMYFDQHLYYIDRYAIDLVAQTIVIYLSDQHWPDSERHEWLP